MPPWNASCIKGGYSKTHLLAVSGAWDATKESYSLNTRRNKRPAFSSPPQRSHQQGLITMRTASTRPGRCKCPL
eukprot:scaffold10580_cov20-Tisochrysis_lutea.AAC.4